MGFQRAVCRTPVDDDMFDVGICLGGDALKAGFEMVLVIEDCSDD